MIYNSKSEVVNSLREKQFYNVYLIYGNENYVKRNCLDQIVKTVLDENFKDMNYHIFSGKELDIENLNDTVEILPFFAEKRVVVVDGFDYNSLNKSDEEKIEYMFQNPPNSTVQIYLVDDEEFSDKTTKGKKLVSMIKKCGACVKIDKLSQTQLSNYIKSISKKYGCKVSSGICNLIIQGCNRDVSMVKNECEKIFAYAKGQEVTGQHVRDVMVFPIEASAFDIIKKIEQDDFTSAIRIISNLLYLREPVVKILGGINMNFIDIYRAKLAVSEGKTGQEIMKDFSYRSQYRVQNAMNMAKRFSKKYIDGAFNALTDADYDAKSSSISDNIILEKLVTKLFMLKKEQ